MKKTYIIPEIEIIETLQEQSLLIGSTSSRSDEGDPTNNGLPSDIGNTTDTEDPFGGHGQDGGTTRAPGFFGDLE